MPKNRIEAFTDAIIAIVMTILVLELHTPENDSFLAFSGIEHELVIYLVSFIMLAIYWNNHHHLFQLVRKVDGGTLWANNCLIFALTLFPFATAWVSEFPMSLAPQVLYGILILVADVSYYALVRSLVRVNGANSKVHQLAASYPKLIVTISLNIIAILIGYLVAPVWILIINGCGLLLWFIPEKLAERLHIENER